MCFEGASKHSHCQVDSLPTSSRGLMQGQCYSNSRPKTATRRRPKQRHRESKPLSPLCWGCKPLAPCKRAAPLAADVLPRWMLTCCGKNQQGPGRTTSQRYSSMQMFTCEAVLLSVNMTVSCSNMVNVVVWCQTAERAVKHASSVGWFETVRRHYASDAAGALVSPDVVDCCTYLIGSSPHLCAQRCPLPP